MTAQMTVATGNEGQAEAWSGDGGEQWAGSPTFFDDAVRFQHAALFDGARIAPAERVLDVGCGNGQTTREAARLAREGGAVGIDLSPQMIARARTLAADEGITNASFVEGDAQIYRFDASSFDLAISRTGAMFFADQIAALSNIAHALRPGGRAVFVSWQSPAVNDWLPSIAEALTLGVGLPTPPPDHPGPFAHADPDRTTHLFEQAGFDAIELRPVEGPFYLGRTVHEGVTEIGRYMAWMMGGLDEAGRREALERLRRTFASHLTSDGVAFPSAAWLISARRP